MSKKGNTGDVLRCSFCNKSQRDVKKLIAGPGAVYICDECVELCREIIEEEAGPTKAKTGQKVPPPQALYEQLSEYVIGQDKGSRETRRGQVRRRWRAAEMLVLR